MEVVVPSMSIRMCLISFLGVCVCVCVGVCVVPLVCVCVCVCVVGPLQQPKPVEEERAAWASFSMRAKEAGEAVVGTCVCVGVCVCLCV
jgi:hypothetical protein